MDILGIAMDVFRVVKLVFGLYHRSTRVVKLMIGLTIDVLVEIKRNSKIVKLVKRLYHKSLKVVELMMELHCRSPKVVMLLLRPHHMDILEVAMDVLGVIETKGNKIIKNVQTCWMSMKSLVKHVLSKYKTLMVTMDVDMIFALGHKVSTKAKENFDLLGDIEVLLSLLCFISLLNAMYNLMKLSQERDTFICEFTQAIKVCQGELPRSFVNGSTTHYANDFHSIMILCL